MTPEEQSMMETPTRTAPVPQRMLMLVTAAAAAAALLFGVLMAASGSSPGSTAAAWPKPPRGLDLAKGCVVQRALSRKLRLWAKAEGRRVCVPPLRVKISPRFPQTLDMAAATGVAWCTLTNWKPGFARHPATVIMSIGTAAAFCGNGQKTKQLGWAYVRWRRS
jgi:hypothetical protein